MLYIRSEDRAGRPMVMTVQTPVKGNPLTEVRLYQPTSKAEDDFSGKLLGHILLNQHDTAELKKVL